jgi:hypothetical protein
MSDQLPLLAPDLPAPKLTPQQTLVLARLEAAGADGLHADEVGAIAHSVMESRWQHHEGERCEYCAQRGLQLLRSLRAKGLVRYRAKLKAWQAAGVGEPEREVRGMLRDDEDLPF